MKKKLVIKNRRVYEASIKNWNYSNFKNRPVIVIKQSRKKVLAIQLTTTNPKLTKLSKSLLKETDGRLKGVYLKTSHWIDKSLIVKGFFFNKNPVEISNKLSKEMINSLNKVNIVRNKKIRRSIDKSIFIYLKTNDKKYLNLAKNKVKEWRHYDIKFNYPKNINNWIEKKIEQKKIELFLKDKEQEKEEELDYEIEKKEIEREP